MNYEWTFPIYKVAQLKATLLKPYFAIKLNDIHENLQINIATKITTWLINNFDSIL